MNPRLRLREDLLRGYTKEVHPVKNHKGAVKVDVGMALIHLSLEEKQSVLEVEIIHRELSSIYCNPSRWMAG